MILKTEFTFGVFTLNKHIFMFQEKKKGGGVEFQRVLSSKSPLNLTAKTISKFVPSFVTNVILTLTVSKHMQCRNASWN